MRCLTSRLILTGPLSIAACASSARPDGPPVVAGGSPSASAGEGAEPAAGASASTASAARGDWREGERVVVRGTISRTPWQHMITSVEGKRGEYFDLEDGWQTVIYVRDLPPCAGRLEVEATVLRVAGAGKRPGSDPADEYVELQLDVSAARCME